MTVSPLGLLRSHHPPTLAQWAGAGFGAESLRIGLDAYDRVGPDLDGLAVDWLITCNGANEDGHLSMTRRWPD